MSAGIQVFMFRREAAERLGDSTPPQIGGAIMVFLYADFVVRPALKRGTR